jgi:F0F1-type ATP synthase membrane subunit c/vacuolar-type H+-ATPase subunit K
MISGAFDAMNKEPENKNKIMTYMILFLALIESAAIYGLVVGFQILSDPSIDGYLALAA